MDPKPKDNTTGNPSARDWDSLTDYHKMTDYERAVQAREGAKEAATQELGSKLHDAWRAPRKLEDGSYEPREKQTSDAEWIKKHGTSTVDIANTDFKDLPQDWKQENEDAARVVVELLHKRDVQDLKVKDEDGNYADAVIDMARVVHDEWLGRENNSWAKGGELDVPFDELPKSEQQKDIDQVVLGIELAKADGNEAWGESAGEVEQFYNKYGQDVGFVPYGEGDE